MSDTKASETNELEADSPILSDMKSNLNNCDDTNTNENELVANDDAALKEGTIDLQENGHEVNGASKETDEKKDDNLEVSSLIEKDSSCNEKEGTDDNKPVIIGDSISDGNENLNKSQSFMEIDSKLNTSENVEVNDNIDKELTNQPVLDSTKPTETLNGTDLPEESSLNEQDNSMSDNKDENVQSDLVAREESTDEKNEIDQIDNVQCKSAQSETVQREVLENEEPIDEINDNAQCKGTQIEIVESELLASEEPTDEKNEIKDELSLFKMKDENVQSELVAREESTDEKNEIEQIDNIQCKSAQSENVHSELLTKEEPIDERNENDQCKSTPIEIVHSEVLTKEEPIDEGNENDQCKSAQSENVHSELLTKEEPIDEGNENDQCKSTQIENDHIEGLAKIESIDQKCEIKDKLPLSKMKDDDDDCTQESKMDVDLDEISNGSASDTKTSSLSKASSNILTEVVVGNNDEVTLDLSKTITNGVKESDTSSDVQLLKRDHSSSGCIAEDLSLPSKRRNVENGEHSEANGTINSDDDDDDDEEENYDELVMPPTPPHDDLEDFERIRKIKIYRRLKQELLNEDAKLVLLKKIRQSQLKENISQNNSQHLNSATPTVSNTSTPSTGSMGINLTSNLRDLNILANHYQTSLSQASGANSALNFSTSHNSKSVSNLVNNNVAHINSHPNLFLQKNLPNLNLAHQAPIQAHLPKTTSHGKGNSVLNPPFASSLGRSPYNHLNSHLSAPPPSHHGSNNSSKQRNSSYDTPNLNTAHSSHRSASLNSNSLNRSSMATPPNLGYPELRQSSSSNAKFSQSNISQSASPSPTVHNTVSDNSTRADPLLVQRQAANVKQVLRKQLEKMPQPKVPPPEMHFVPNPSNAEFICYIGLEKVVDYLTGNNQVFHPPEPFECVQCGTDFTPVWKWKDRSDPSKPSVICENCVSKNMKKVVIDEHTKRINTFSKAYEELEKQMASVAASAGTMTPPSAAISPSITSNSATGSSGQHSASSNLTTSHSSNSGSHNLFGSNNSAAAAVAAAAANFGSIGAGLSGYQHQQAHSNSPLSSVGGLTAQQVAAMASFLPQVSNTSSAHQMSTPPAAHSSSRSSSNSFASNLAAAFNPSSSNASAQSTAATMALLQQFPKMNSQAQSLLLAQQLQAFSALAGGGNQSNASNAAMAQLLGFPNLYLSSLLAATIANQKSSQNQSSSSNSNLNAAAAAAVLQRQFLMDILPGASGNTRSGHSSNSNSSMPHHNWKS